jgi:cellulose synthase/poly-beta-1,6-N-acetylglucosamine synthase-like glycosyltransferase
MPFSLQARGEDTGEKDITEAVSGRPETASAEISPEPVTWIDLFLRLDLTIEQSAAILRRAEGQRTPILRELAVSGLVAEARIYRELANVLGLLFEDDIDPEKLILRERDVDFLLRQGGNKSLIVKMEAAPGTMLVLCAPVTADLAAMIERVRRSPSLVSRIRIVAPSALRRAVAARGERRLQTQAEENLFHEFSSCSARFVVTGRQGVWIGAALVGFPVAMAAIPNAAELSVHLFFSAFFFLCVGLRLWAAASFEPQHFADIKTYTPDQFPTYSVLVALYREAEIIPDLFTALGRIVWPRGKLEIKLVCEADDTETLLAIEAHGLRPFAEIIRVPAGALRTKPRALAYAVAMTSGEFIALYDAEDRPHPLQLVEAWQKFAAADAALACVQAPLVVSNHRRSNVARMFAFEYAALFRALLPALAGRRLVFPLGGTSNHFRRAALEAVGGWDPYNVTEDADLGLRLARFGYHAEMISRPTFEDAPESVATWLPQRTRWFKGWMQSYLVHMRQPCVLWRELGPASFLVFQILFAGMILSAIGHPIFLATISYALMRIGEGAGLDGWHSSLFAFDCCNIFLGYTAFLVLGWQVLGETEKPGFWKTILLTPFYWFLMSIAALRAVWKLYSAPHQWEKTPHFRREGAVDPSSQPKPKGPDISRPSGNPGPRR